MKQFDYVDAIFPEIKDALPHLELGLYGGGYHHLKVVDGVPVTSESTTRYTLNLRGIKKRRYFSLFLPPTPVEHIRDHLRYLKPQKISPFPLLTSREHYRNVAATSPFLEQLDPLLIYHHLQKELGSLLKKGELSLIVKSGSIHPGFQPVQPIAIENNRGISARYNNRRGFISIKQGEIAHHFSISSKGDLENIATKLETINNNATLSRGTIPPGRYRIILGRRGVAKLIQAMGKHFSTTAAKGGNWFFKGHYHSRLFSRHFHLEDSPYHTAIQGRPFDDIGMAKERLVLIDDGYFKGLTVSYHEGERFKVSPTGHTRLTDQSSTLTYPGMKGAGSDLLNQSDQTIFIPDLTPHIKPPETISNLPVIGNGILYRGGKAIKQLPNLTLQISLKELFNRIITSGEVKLMLGAAVPDFLIDKIPLIQS